MKIEIEGKTVASVKIQNGDNWEEDSISITFTDGSILTIQSFSSHGMGCLDFALTEKPK